MGKLPWDAENAFQEEEDGNPNQEAVPIDPVSPEELETVYLAYLEELRGRGNLIGQFAQWYSFAGEMEPVAIVDILGDAAPELIYVDVDPNATSEAYLNILTYRDGELQTVWREYCDLFAENGMPFTLYQSEDSRQLYFLSAYYMNGTQYYFEVRTTFVDTEDGGFEVQELRSNNGLLLWNDQQILRPEYEALEEDFPTTYSAIVMSNRTKVEGSSFQFVFQDTLAMTYDQAVAYLEEAIVQS